MREDKVIIYNINLIPDGHCIADIIEAYHTTGFVLYRSEDEKAPPYVIDINNLDTDIVFINSSDYEVDV